MTDVEILRKICIAYEQELKKRMSSEEFEMVMARIAKSLFSEELQGTPFADCDVFADADEDYIKLIDEFDETQIYTDDGDLGDEDF